MTNFGSLATSTWMASDPRAKLPDLSARPRLASFIRFLKTSRPGDDVALVLNGDIIDSLAEDSVPGYVAADVETALRMMDRIYADPAFAPVWGVLAEFVRTDKRHLIIVVGNHDIELALTPVEASLRKRLAGGD